MNVQLPALLEHGVLHGRIGRLTTEGLARVLLGRVVRQRRGCGVAIGGGLSGKEETNYY